MEESSVYSSFDYSYANITGEDGVPLHKIIPISVAYFIVFVTGVIGNSVVLFSIYKSRRLHTITCIFLANIALVDLMVSLLVIPIQFGQEFLTHWPYGAAICRTVSYLMMINPACSVFSLTLISFERFYVVLYPLKAKAVLTFRRAKLAVLIVWVLACTFSIPNIFKQDVMKHRGSGIPYCAVSWKPNSVQYKIYATFNLIFLLILPTGMMTLAYISVTYALYKNKKATAGRKQSSPGRLSVTFQNGATKLQLHPSDEPSSTSTLLSDVSPAREVRRDLNGNRSNAKNRSSPFRNAGFKQERDEDADKIRRIVVMLIVIVLLFIICWSPVLVLNFLIRFEIIYPDNDVEVILSIVSHLMAFGNSSVNPFAYALLSKNFRESAKQVFRQCCFKTEQRHLRHRPSISSTRFSRLSSSIPRWKGTKNDNVIKEDPV